MKVDTRWARSASSGPAPCVKYLRTPIILELPVRTSALQSVYVICRLVQYSFIHLFESDYKDVHVMCCVHSGVAKSLNNVLGPLLISLLQIYC